MADNVFEAHVLPRRKAGDVEHINIEIFNTDGSPFELPAPAETPQWNTVANADMQHGWTSLGANYAVKFRKRLDGTVEFRGYAKPGTEDLMFYLPEGFRPINLDFTSLTFPVVGFNPSGPSYGLCAVAIGADGAVYAAELSTDAYYIHLAAIRFSTD
jgi:hypothetical protein